MENIVLNNMNSTDISLPINIMNLFLYEDQKELCLDIYYNDKGFPAVLHDKYGAMRIEDYRLKLINHILQKNNTENIYRVSSDAFVVMGKSRWLI